MIPRHLIIAATLLAGAVLGMSLYVWHMRGSEGTNLFPNASVRPVAPPVSGPTEQVTLAVAYDDAGLIHLQSVQIALPSNRQQRAEELLRALLDVYLDRTSPHPLPAGADIRAVYLVDPGLAVIDLNSAFANGHRSGILPEELTVISLAQTLAANLPGIFRVKILVDGKPRDTLAGHADLSGFYDVSAVGQLATQLQSAP
jgi:Sporulation and spore germination